MTVDALIDVHCFLIFYFFKVKMFVHDYSLAWTQLLREQNGTKKEPGKNYAVALETRLNLY